MTPFREILLNIDPPGIIALYLLMAVPAGLLAYGLARRIRRWRSGKPESRRDEPGRRAMAVFRAVFLHARTFRRRNWYGGLMHLAIFWGFVTLLAGTLLVMIESDIAVPLLGVSFLQGRFYLGFKLAMNLAGLLLIAGVLLALYRRLALRPATQQSSADDLLVLAFLLLLAVQGFVLQGLRLAYAQDPWAMWSFVSYPIAAALKGASRDDLGLLHRLSWHAHFLTALLFLGYIAWSKMIHPFTALGSLYFQRLRPRGELSPVPDLERAEAIGAGKLEQFNWAQLMSLDACTHCGRCLEYCPTFATGKPLRPRDLVLALAGFQADKGGIFSGVLGEAANAGRFRSGKGPARELIGGVVSPEEIWDCTTCGACMEQCPVGIEHVPFIVEMRRNLVTEQDAFPAELAPVFTSLDRLGNPYQAMPAERGAWTRKLAQPPREMSELKASGGSVEYLFFVGCLGSYVPKNQNATIALARILQAAGIRFAILGKEERCHGDPARRMGHEFLAHKLASRTVEQFNFYNVRKVVTGCPHCFNAIRNEFPQLGGNYEVVHHSQLIAELIASGRVALEARAPAAAAARSITYHDPCYLSRYNGTVDEPRKALADAVSVPLVEMPRNRKHSFCCGGGGGRAFMKEERGSRINQERTREAIGTGAEIVAAACPFCAGMLDDGIGALSAASKIRVVDLAELVADSMKQR